MSSFEAIFFIDIPFGLTYYLYLETKLNRSLGELARAEKFRLRDDPMNLYG